MSARPSKPAIRSFYDRLGSQQEEGGYYAIPSFEELLRQLGGEPVGQVAELGCGTGHFAELLLERQGAPAGRYQGWDPSPTMVSIARRRLARFRGRAQVEVREGPGLPLPEASADLLCCNYVLDLLSDSDIRLFLSEARRILKPRGRLGLINLTFGATLPSTIKMGLWRLLHAIRPLAVGGCRPLDVRPFLAEGWRISHHSILVRRAMPSQIVVAERPSPVDRPAPGDPAPPLGSPGC